MIIVLWHTISFGYNLRYDINKSKRKNIMNRDRDGKRNKSKTEKTIMSDLKM